jgi:hypothetical protein
VDEQGNPIIRDVSWYDSLSYEMELSENVWDDWGRAEAPVQFLGVPEGAEVMAVFIDGGHDPSRRRDGGTLPAAEP